jgi:phosphate uptake regulator
LPKKWCDSYGLKEGEDIDISEKGSCLVLSKEAYKGAGSVTVDVTGLNGSTIILLIYSLYTYGYDEIRVTTRDTKAHFYQRSRDMAIGTVIGFALQKLMGAELVSSTKTSYQIEVLTEDSREKFDSVLRRIFRQIFELFDAYFDHVKREDIGIREAVDTKFTETKRMVNYAMRLLNKFGHEDATKTTTYFAIVDFLGRIAQTIKNNVEYTIRDERPHLSRRCMEFLAQVRESFDLFYNMFYSYDVKKMHELQKNRDVWKNEVAETFRRLGNDDVMVLAAFELIYDNLLDLSELRMAIGYK